jgi:hypothetical protein
VTYHRETLKAGLSTHARGQSGRQGFHVSLFGTLGCHCKDDRQMQAKDHRSDAESVSCSHAVHKTLKLNRRIHRMTAKDEWFGFEFEELANLD